MKPLSRTLAVCAIVLFCYIWARIPNANARDIPQPGEHHPGNVFLEGETVVVTLAESGIWELVDVDNQPLREIKTGGPGEQVELGRLPVGFYRLRHAGDADWVSLAVLTPLQTPTPATSPIAVDVAMSWFYSREEMSDVASLCTLAGVNWVRDRLSWGEVEPEQGEFREETRYDAAADAQSSAGLNVLQVHHSSPRWANENHKRFPLDLRDTYRFHRHIAARWQGKVDAFEPWNEADITVFGGHTGAEMASFQKAAYWGIKAGNPQAIACLNVFATHNQAQLDDLDANRAWPYFETFNLHHYVAFEQYPQVYSRFREVSAGRPLWVTECAMPLQWSGDEDRKELSDEDLREQARRLVKVFAGSLHEGSAATFYFLLPHYVEGPTQFGILRRDLTPRPAYVSLAAVGRLLADARALGRLHDDDVRGYAFRAAPQGNQRIVLVAWSAEPITWEPPSVPEAVFDYLGRSQEAHSPITLDTSPRFLLFAPAAAESFSLESPPEPPLAKPGEPCPVVLQSIWPEDECDLGQSAYRVAGQGTVSVPVYVYNFGSEVAEGTIRCQGPAGATIELPDRCQIEPMARLAWETQIALPEACEAAPHTFLIEGDFGAAGQSTLSFRLLPEEPSNR